MRRKRVIIIAATLTITTILSLVIISPRRGSVRYHEERLNYLRRPISMALYRDAPSELDSKGRPVHLVDFLRFRTWRWYWQGAFTITTLIEEQEKHQQALIQLGYYERREFVLTNRTIDAQLFAMITNGVHGESLWLQLNDSKDRWLRVTARKEDMPLVERTVVMFDTSVAK